MTFWRARNSPIIPCPLPLAYSARADLCRRLGRLPEARTSYEKALALARQEPERRFLSGRLEELK